MRTRGLHDSLSELRTTIREDHPTSGDTVLVDVFGDAVDDLMGWLAEAQEGVLAAHQALLAPSSADLVRHGLSVCHRNSNKVLQRYLGDLSQHERIAGLEQLGRERRGEWQAWTAGVQQGIERCREPLQELFDALLDCWLDVTDRSTGIASFFDSASARPQGG
jgi:hypothetical protein